jgi:hypothetical protein
MEWTTTDTIALAKHSCSQCHGLGLRGGDGTSDEPCNCVLRTIFRTCYARFRHCASKEKHISHASVEFVAGREGKFSWGRKDEEYIADFCLVSRRALEDYQYRIFKFHFLLEADWKLCTRRLNIDRGNFFHEVYRIEQKLGRVFRELEPYGLYPLDEYFHGPRYVPARDWGFRSAGMSLPLAASRGALRAPLLARIA